MKTILRLAVLALTSTAALALAGNALATQKLSIRQAATSLTIKLSQAQSDPQPARISIYVPTGYTINASAAPGTKIGTTSGSVFARDQNSALPLSGNVVVAADSSAPTCDPAPHIAVWNLALAAAGQNMTLPVHVDQTTGTDSALGAYKLVVCLGPSDVPPGTPGRSPNGAQLLEALLKVDNIFTMPAGAQSVWKAVTTPYKPSVGTPNPAGMVETRAHVANGTVTITSKITDRAKRIVRFTGKVSQAGAAVAGAQLNLLINGLARFRAKTSAGGSYSLTLRKKTGRASTSTFQARVTVAERDITSSGCASPTFPGVACVSATSSTFTAVSRTIRIRL